MQTPRITRTIVQKLDDNGNVLSEVVTTVEEIVPTPAPVETFGLYL